MFSVRDVKPFTFSERGESLSSNVIRIIVQDRETELKRDKRKPMKQSRYDLFMRGLERLASDYNYYQLSQIQKEKFNQIIADACCQFILEKGKIRYDRNSMVYHANSPFWRIFFNKLDEVKTLNIFTQAAANVLTEGPLPSIDSLNKVAASVTHANRELEETIYAVKNLKMAMDEMSDKTLELALEEAQVVHSVSESVETILDRARARQAQRQVLSRLTSPTAYQYSAQGSIGLSSATSRRVGRQGLFGATSPETNPELLSPSNFSQGGFNVAMSTEPSIGSGKRMG